MATELQEFFSSADDESRLVQLIIESGFTKVPEWKRGFKTGEAFIDVQEIDDPNHIAKKSGHQYGFILELYQPLERLASDHPVRTFFRKLQEPQAYGLCGLKPQYKIEDYIQKS